MILIIQDVFCGENYITCELELTQPTQIQVHVTNDGTNYISNNDENLYIDILPIPVINDVSPSLDSVQMLH